jgi:hypothetical protein
MYENILVRLWLLSGQLGPSPMWTAIVRAQARSVRNRAWGPSAIRILYFTVALISSPSFTELEARIKRRSIQVISRTISQMHVKLIRARQPLPFPTWSNMGPRRSCADSLPLAIRRSYSVVHATGCL